MTEKIDLDYANEYPPPLKDEFATILAKKAQQGGEDKRIADNIAKMRWYARPDNLTHVVSILCATCDLLGVFDASEGKDYKADIKLKGWIRISDGEHYCSKLCYKKAMNKRQGDDGKRWGGKRRSGKVARGGKFTPPTGKGRRRHRKTRGEF